MKGLVRCWVGMVLAGVALFVSGCGGGGDGVAVGPFRDAQMSFDTSPLNIEVLHEDMGTFINDPKNSPMLERTIRFQGLDLTKLPDDFALVAIVGEEASLSHLDISFFALDSQRVQMYIRPSGYLLPGEYSGQVWVVACKLDEAREDCAEHMRGSPSVPISYHFNLYPRLLLDTYQTTVWRTQGSSSTTSVPIVLRGVISQDDLSADVRYTEGTGGWLKLMPGDLGYSYTVTSEALPIGEYFAEVDIRSALSGTSVTSLVKLVVRANTLSVVHSGEVLEVTDDTRLTDLRFEVPIELSNASLSTTWSATSDVPWIVFEKGSGVTGEHLIYRISSDFVASMATEARGASVGQQGVITLANTGPLSIEPVELPIHVYRFISELEAVVSPPVPAGVAGYRVQLKGFNFTESTRLQFSGPSAWEMMNDGSLSVLPSVPGQYFVSAVNALGISTRQVTATFLATASHTNRFIASSGFKRSLVYDQSRDALYSADKTGSVLRRFSHANGGWTEDHLPVESISDIGLSPDRQKLFVSSVDGVLREFDPASLNLRGTYALGQPFPEYRKLSQGLAFQGLHTPHIPFLTPYVRSGTYDFAGGVVFSVNTRQFVPLTGYGYALDRGGWFVQSGDHDFAYFSQQRPDAEFGNYAGVLRDAYLMSSAYHLSFGARPTFETLDVGLTSVGGFGLVDRQRYMSRSGFGWADVPALPEGYRVTGSVVSADWKFIYLLAYPEAAINGDQATSLKPKVFAFQVDGPGDYGTTITLMPESLELEDFPTCRRNADASCLLDTVSATSMDGRTLFFAGDRGVALVALPAQFRTSDSIMRMTKANRSSGIGAWSRPLAREAGRLHLPRR